MLGIYGIAADSKFLDPKKRKLAFIAMSSRIDTAHFNSVLISTERISIGVSRRNNHENKDISLIQINPNHIIVFSGYARLKGEKDFCWADEMISVVKDRYKNNGLTSLEEIEGSFECVICKDEHLLIMSDRFGSKKQYIAEHNNIILFAPDAGQIIAADLVPKAKNLDAAAQILISGFFMDDSTLDKNITRFPFATILSKNLTQSKASTRYRYWYPPTGNGTITKMDDHLVESFKDVMQASVWDLQKLSSKTIVPLSGGLDSRAIACFLSKRQKLATLTYDFGDEVNVARKVSKMLAADHLVVRNSVIKSPHFETCLNELIRRQYFQVVINQYFYAPLFYEHMAEHQQFDGLYDGIFMGLLFSAPYINPTFDYDRVKSVYGRGIQVFGNFAEKLTPAFLDQIMRKQYDRICRNAGSHGEFDGYGLSQLFYISGRLRRYVCETYHSRENYGYVFKPGFDYRLADFGFNLDLSLRKGVIYQHMLRKHFRNVMKIIFKDSYGNREKKRVEKIRSSFKKIRMKISGLSNGRIGYTPYQVDHYFLKMKKMDQLKPYFFGENHIPEFFSEKEIQHIFNEAKKKFYLFNLVQRVQVLNNYYKEFEY